MVNLVSKVYKRVKKSQNKKIRENMIQMQCAGRTHTRAINSIIKMSVIREKTRTERLNTYLFFPNAVKCIGCL